MSLFEIPSDLPDIDIETGFAMLRTYVLADRLMAHKFRREVSSMLERFAAHHGILDMDHGAFTRELCSRTPLTTLLPTDLSWSSWPTRFTTCMLEIMVALGLWMGFLERSSTACS